MSQLDNGEEVDLTGYYEKLTRREFLKASGIAATGALSVSTLVKRTYGAEPEGKTIVKKKDGQGRPAVVKSVDPERYRRLKAYEHFRPHELSIESIVGATIRQRSEDPTDIAIQIGIDANEVSKRKGPKLKDISRGAGKDMTKEIANAMGLPKRPGKIRGMKKAFQNARRHLSTTSDSSTDFDDIPIEYTPMTSKCEKQSLRGGSSESGGGTMTMVGWDEDDIPVVVTAHHVAENPNSPEEINWDGYTISNVHDYDMSQEGSVYTDPVFGQDIISFYLVSVPPQEFDTNVDKALTKPEIPDIVGYWTFEGMADETSWYPIIGENIDPVYCYGYKSGKVKNKINKTVRNTSGTFIKYGARTSNEVTDHGDSGGPWVDEEGYLCGHNVGGPGTLTGECSELSVAGKSLETINVTLAVTGGKKK